MYKRNDLSLFLLEVWAKSAQTAGFGRIWNSCSSGRKNDFCNWNLWPPYLLLFIILTNPYRVGNPPVVSSTLCVLVSPIDITNKIVNAI